MQIAHVHDVMGHQAARKQHGEEQDHRVELMAGEARLGKHISVQAHDHQAQKGAQAGMRDRDLIGIADLRAGGQQRPVGGQAPALRKEAVADVRDALRRGK